MDIIEAFITGINASQGSEITYNINGVQVLSNKGRVVAIRVHQGRVFVIQGQEFYGLISELLDSLDNHHIEYHIVKTTITDEI